MAYVITDNLIGAQAIASTSTTQKHPIMKEIKATDSSYGEGAFIYAKASAAVVVGDTVWINFATGYAQVITDALAKAGVGLPAMSMSAVAADEWAWFMRSGTHTAGRIKPGVEGNTALYVNASAGTLGGTTLSNMIGGIVAVTSATTTVGAVTCHLTFPYIVRAVSLMAV